MTTPMATHGDTLIFTADVEVLMNFDVGHGLELWLDDNLVYAGQSRQNGEHYARLQSCGLRPRGPGYGDFNAIGILPVTALVDHNGKPYPAARVHQLLSSAGHYAISGFFLPASSVVIERMAVMAACRFAGLRGQDAGLRDYLQRCTRWLRTPKARRHLGEAAAQALFDELLVLVRAASTPELVAYANHLYLEQCTQAARSAPSMASLTPSLTPSPARPRPML